MLSRVGTRVEIFDRKIVSQTNKIPMYFNYFFIFILFIFSYHSILYVLYTGDVHKVHRRI